VKYLFAFVSAFIAAVLAADEVGPVLRRMLVEEDDDLRRAIACRAVAAPEVRVSPQA